MARDVLSLGLTLHEKEILDNFCRLGMQKEPVPYRLIFEILLRNWDLQKTLRSGFKGEFSELASSVYMSNRANNVSPHLIDSRYILIELSSQARTNLNVLKECLSVLAKEEAVYPYYYTDERALKELLQRVKEGLDWKGKLDRWKKFKKSFEDRLAAERPLVAHKVKVVGKKTKPSGQKTKTATKGVVGVKPGIVKAKGTSTTKGVVSVKPGIVKAKGTSATKGVVGVKPGIAKAKHSSVNADKRIKVTKIKRTPSTGNKRVKISRIKKTKN